MAKAVASDLLAFISREGGWRERLPDVAAEYLLPALAEFEIDHEDLAELLGDYWPGMLWGGGFENFLSRMTTAISSIFT